MVLNERSTYDAASLEATTNQNLNRTGTEQHLVKAEYNLRNDRRAGRRRSLHTHHTKISHVANEWPRRPRVRQRVAPEHPLERRDCSDHEGLEDERETALPAYQPAIEKADTRDDEPYDAGGEDQEDVVVFVAGVLGVDVDGGVLAVSTQRVRWVIYWLLCLSIFVSRNKMIEYLLRLT